MDMPFIALFWPDMPFNALFWPDMPFNALFWPRYAVQCSLFSTEVPFNALFLARKCRSMPPDVLNILHMLDIPARELLKKNPKRADSHWNIEA
jgi:hypothetical protein